MVLSAYRYDVDRSNFIDFMELKLMMEKLGEPQTHLALKDMIKTVDEDNDGEISFREVSTWKNFPFFPMSVLSVCVHVCVCE